MLFKHTMSIVTANNSLLFKLLIYMLIISVIFGTLFYAIVKPVVSDIIDEAQSLAELNPEDASFENVGDVYRAVQNIFRNVADTLNSKNTRAVQALILIVVLLLVIRFLAMLTYVPTTTVIYGKITQNYDAGFLNTFVATLAKSFKFASLATVVTFATDVITVLIGVLFATVTMPVLGLFSLTFGFALTILLYSLRVAVLWQWLPAIVCRKQPVLRAFVDCFRVRPFFFARLYGSTVAITGLTFGIIAATFILTAGLIPIVAAVVMAIFLLTQSLVVSCVDQKQDYYIDALTVVKSNAHNKEEQYETEVSEGVGIQAPVPVTDPPSDADGADGNDE